MDSRDTTDMAAHSRQALRGHLDFLYGPAKAAEILPRLEQLIADHQSADPQATVTAWPLDERDVILITYADMLRKPDEAPLRTLEGFLKAHLAPLISGVHLLPFFPYSSDDGFSVIDYRSVNPAVGTWRDVQRIAHSYRLMVDAVVNHISVQSDWFQGFLDGRAPYTNYFVTTDPSADLETVVRPRDRPLLTAFDTPSGVQHVWTTFSEDQVDLNFANPEVLLEILDVLLEYVRRGAQLIRLDAIAFIWKEPGTPSIHLPQTHRIVKLMRTVLERTAPGVLILTETNVPHAENLSYFGDGTDEAHLVYQFALPPLVLHTLTTGDADRLSAWAASLATPSRQTAFFNFLASHDGIGLRPVQDLLSETEIEALVQRTEAHGGAVSHRRVQAGGRRPYELNITYFDALTAPDEMARDAGRAIDRFLVSQAILLSLAGVPGVYFHSLFGSRNDQEGYQRSGQPRAINRQKLAVADLTAELADLHSIRARVFAGMQRLLTARRSAPAFHPQAPQQVMDLGRNVFAIERVPLSNEGPKIVCLHEVHGASARIRLRGRGRDLLSGAMLDLAECSLAPYQVRWIERMS